MKPCRHCGIEKPLAAYYRDSAARDGHRPECIDCSKRKRREQYANVREASIRRARAWQLANPERHRANQQRRRAKPENKLKEREGYLRRKYGITLEEYSALFEAQGGLCALCRREPTEGISLHVDHDHETGEIRGLLCFLCNNALGDFDDDPVRLRAAADYLDPPFVEDPDTIELVRERVRALSA